jgi:hypothetical protein
MKIMYSRFIVQVSSLEVFNSYQELEWQFLCIHYRLVTAADRAYFVFDHYLSVLLIGEVDVTF